MTVASSRPRQKAPRKGRPREPSERRSGRSDAAGDVNGNATRPCGACGRYAVVTFVESAVIRGERKVWVRCSTCWRKEND